MNVTPEEVQQFYELYAALLSFVNARLNVVPERFSDAPEYVTTSPETRLAVRNALYENRQLIDQFVAENPAGMPADELAIVEAWKHALFGKFYIFRYLAKHTIFLSSGCSPNKAYGVLGLADSIQEIMGPRLPRLIQTALLPFHGQIVYDGLLGGFNLSFGPGIKNILNEEYKQAKRTFGIVTFLGDQRQTLTDHSKKGSKKRASVRSGASVPTEANKAKAIADQLIQMTDAFCGQYLNEEYAELCRKLAGTLARKRPSPLLQGRLESWASGIVRTIGWANFLDDRRQSPHLKLPFIDQFFGVGESTGQGKSKAIRAMLKIRTFDQRWTLPSRMDDNPMVWMLEVDGLIMDMRDAPRDLQEIAFAKGLIPYIPADRGTADDA